jgi:hypothetical protein
MQQEDDLRGLAKVMEFMRAVSVSYFVLSISIGFVTGVLWIGGLTSGLSIKS